MSRRVTQLLEAMTLEERIGQITQVDRTAITPDEVATLGIGSILSGGGGNPTPNTPAAWRAMVDEYVAASQRSRLGIPILYGTDAVHGHNNVVGATIFPHNIGLGAADDPELVEAIGRATALETAATGARWAFAPTVAVPQDVRWGRTYEGYGQDPARVAALGAALVRGLQGAGSEVDVLACAKHFVADGATTWGTTGGAQWSEWWTRSYGNPNWRIDQGDARIDEATLREVHLPPYRAAIAAGVGSVMASYSSWNGTKVHGHRELLTDLLKDELGFEGLVVSDYVAVDQVSADYHEAVARCLEAGIDLVMVPFDHERFRAAVRDVIDRGELAMDRLDDAVRRVLTVKESMGLLDGSAGPLPDLTVVGAPEHRALARRAAPRQRARSCSPTTPRCCRWPTTRPCWSRAPRPTTSDWPAVAGPSNGAGCRGRSRRAARWPMGYAPTSAPACRSLARPPTTPPPWRGCARTSASSRSTRSPTRRAWATGNSSRWTPSRWRSSTASPRRSTGSSWWSSPDGRWSSPTSKQRSTRSSPPGGPAARQPGPPTCWSARSPSSDVSRWTGRPPTARSQTRLRHRHRGGSAVTA